MRANSVELHCNVKTNERIYGINAGAHKLDWLLLCLHINWLHSFIYLYIHSQHPGQAIFIQTQRKQKKVFIHIWFDRIAEAQQRRKAILFIYFYCLIWSLSVQFILNISFIILLKLHCLQLDSIHLGRAKRKKTISEEFAHTKGKAKKTKFKST